MNQMTMNQMTMNIVVAVGVADESPLTHRRRCERRQRRQPQLARGLEWAAQPASHHLWSRI